jgi:hypothetical protein
MSSSGNSNSNSSHGLELDNTECPPVAPTVAVRGKKMFKLVAAVGNHSSSSSSSSSSKRSAADKNNVQNESHKCSSNNNNGNNDHLKSGPTMDLLSPLPEDMLCRITSFLDARSLLQMRTINRSFHVQAARNAAGWDNLCTELWKEKIHVCAEAIHMHSMRTGINDNRSAVNVDRHGSWSTAASGITAQQPERGSISINNSIHNNNSSLTAYKLSLHDSQNRHHVSRQELCYDVDTMTGTVWSFRFKESAGSDWTVQDPWYNGLPCRKMVFLPDGSVKQYIPAAVTTTTTTETATSGASGNTLSSATASTRNDGTVLPHHHPPHPLHQPHPLHHQPPPQQLFHDRPGPNFGHVHQRIAGSAASASAASPLAAGMPTLVDPHMTMTWRFLTRPMDLPTRETGSYVRFSVGGRDVPTYSVRRSPTGNWGFVMESCWGIYASFELPAIQVAAAAAAAVNATAAVNASNTNNNYSRHHRGAVRQERTRRRLRRTENGAVWVDEAEDEEEDDAHAAIHNNISGPDADIAGINARERARIDGEASLREDASLLITNEIQWREAFLYNVGARVLPEGDEAADEFDRAWGGL